MAIKFDKVNYIEVYTVDIDKDDKGNIISIEHNGSILFHISNIIKIEEYWAKDMIYYGLSIKTKNSYEEYDIMTDAYHDIVKALNGYTCGKRYNSVTD